MELICVDSCLNIGQTEARGVKKGGGLRNLKGDGSPGLNDRVRFVKKSKIRVELEQKRAKGCERGVGPKFKERKMDPNQGIVYPSYPYPSRI